MNDASLLYVRVDGRVKQVLDEVMRDDGYVSDVARDDQFLEAGVVWRRGREPRHRRGGR
jgi:hypothetical protein